VPPRHADEGRYPRFFRQIKDVDGGPSPTMTVRGRCQTVNVSASWYYRTTSPLQALSVAGSHADPLCSTPTARTASCKARQQRRISARPRSLSRHSQGSIGPIRPATLPYSAARTGRPEHFV
jgi:hypothetical protein